MYFLAQPSVFPHIVLNDALNIFFNLSNGIKSLMCEVVVSASCFLSPDKKE